RAVADKLSELLGQQVIVENRASGGSGTVGTRQVAKSAPDGYTLLLGYTSNLATAPSMYRDIGYDPRKDFAPVGLIAAASGLLLVHPSVAVKNVAELIALMKSSVEPYQVGQPGTGTVNHLASELFALQAGVTVQQIPYKGSQPLITDLAGGHVKVGFNPISVSRCARARPPPRNAPPCPPTCRRSPSRACRASMPRCITGWWRRPARRGRSSSGSTRNCRPCSVSTRCAGASSTKAASPCRPRRKS